MIYKLPVYGSKNLIKTKFYSIVIFPLYPKFPRLYTNFGVSNILLSNEFNEYEEYYVETFLPISNYNHLSHFSSTRGVSTFYHALAGRRPL